MRFGVTLLPLSIEYYPGCNHELRRRCGDDRCNLGTGSSPIGDQQRGITRGRVQDIHRRCPSRCKTPANPHLWSLNLDQLPRNPWRHPHTAKVVHEASLAPHLPRLACLDPPAGRDGFWIMQGHETFALRRKRHVMRLWPVGYDAERRCVAATPSRNHASPLSGKAKVVKTEHMQYFVRISEMDGN